MFEPATDGTAIAIRHRPSGLLCVNPRVVIVPKAARSETFDPAAQSGCISVSQGLQIDVMVIPDFHHTPLKRAIKALVDEAVREQPTLAPAGEASVRDRVATEDLLLASGAEPRRVRLTAGSFGDWIVQVKAHCGTQQASQCADVAGKALLAAMASMAA